MQEILFGSLESLSKRLQSKSLSARELVEAHINRITTINPRLNAVVCQNFEAARTEAHNADELTASGAMLEPLHGIPMTIKDSLDTAGLISTGGTVGRASYVPREDATVVSRLRAAGAILLGKTNTPELTLAFETDNVLYGRTNNPYDESISSGGSSGGAAAAVSVGASVFDIGSDTGGSIRVPAAWCGICGIRPTTGRVSRAGHILPPGGFQDRLTQLGPMCRHVRDLEPLLRIISGRDSRDPYTVSADLFDASKVNLGGMRAAVFTNNGIQAADSETVDVVRAAAHTLANSGMLLCEKRPAGIEETAELWGEISSVDGGAYVAELLKSYGTVEPHRWLAPQELESPIPIPFGGDVSFAILNERWQRFRARMLRFLDRYDVIICPVCAFPAQPHDTWNDVDHILGFTYTVTFNLTGWPAAVVRCGATCSGLPIGVQVVTRPFREDIALAVAETLEKRFGGWQCAPGFVL